MTLTQRALLSAAVALALGSATASAAGPAFYGKLHLSVDGLDDGTGSETVLSNNSSRLGVKGEADMGDGLTAFYQLEVAYAADGEGTSTDDATFTTRNSGIGVKGGFGALTFGRWDMPLKTATGGMDPFSDTVGDYNVVIGNDDRSDNVILYTAPPLGPVGLALAYSPDEDRTKSTDHFGASVTVNGGPVEFALGYQVENGDANADGIDDQRDTLRAGVAIKGGFGEAALVWQSDEIDGGRKDTGYVANFQYPIGNTTLMAQVGEVEREDAAGVTTQEQDLLAVGVMSQRTKATSVYLVYALSGRDVVGTGMINTFASAGRSESVSPAANEDTASAVSVGIVHKF